MGIVKVLKRDLGQQWRRSRNLGEPTSKKVRRAFWAIVFTGKGFVVACRSMRREQLGSRIVYQGKRCFINNWAQGEYPTIADGNGFYIKGVPRKEIKNVVNVSELLHRFRFGFSFYMGSHLVGDVASKTYPELSARSN